MRNSTNHCQGKAARQTINPKGPFPNTFFKLDKKLGLYQHTSKHIIYYHPMSPWDQNFPIRKIKTVQGMSFGYKITCLGVVIWE